jgi:hypothetical protein
MNLDELSKMITFLLGISLAAERAVTILKTAIPLLEDNREAAAAHSAWNNRWRPLTIQLATFLFCCAASAMLTPGGVFTNWMTTTVALSATASLPVVLVGLLASGGSAFWSNILGYTKAAKDIQKALASAATAPAAPAAPEQVQVLKVVGDPAPTGV